MTSLRLWILVLAGTCFAAGLGAGVLLAELRAGSPAPEAAAPGERSEDYRRLFLQAFELAPERQALFAELMRRYDEDVQALRQRALAASLSEIEDALARLGLRYRDAIRNHVLPEDQRPRFDELLAQRLPLPARS